MGKIKFRIVKNNNEKSDQYGKFYARVQSQGTVETQELAEKIHVSGKAVSKWDTGT